MTTSLQTIHSVLENNPAWPVHPLPWDAGGSPQSCPAGSWEPLLEQYQKGDKTFFPLLCCRFQPLVNKISRKRYFVAHLGREEAYSNHNHIFDKDTDKIIDHQFIPLARLPEMYRNIVTAWNGLPLPEKLKGLYPDVAQKLHHLLKEYGEAAVQKAIRMVADSPFLLGKTTNTRGWKHICFGWLLKPGNLKKILENKYRDKSREWNQGYDSVTYPEYIPWSTVQNTVNHTTVTANSYAENPDATGGYGDPLSEEYSADNTAQSCYLDPEYMLQSMDPLTDQARSCLTRTAALLGLTKTPAA